MYELYHSLQLLFFAFIGIPVLIGSTLYEKYKMIKILGRYKEISKDKIMIFIFRYLKLTYLIFCIILLTIFKTYSLTAISTYLLLFFAVILPLKKYKTPVYDIYRIFYSEKGIYIKKNKDLDEDIFLVWDEIRKISIEKDDLKNKRFSLYSYDEDVYWEDLLISDDLVNKFLEIAYQYRINTNIIIN